MKSYERLSMAASERKTLCGRLLLAIPLSCFALLVDITGTSRPAWADSPFLRKGIAAYQTGRFKQAIELLGADPTEFNNPRLHYYMGSAHLRLNDKSSAIREFRIAYAQAPDSEIGRLSEKSLLTLGAGPFSGSGNASSRAKDKAGAGSSTSSDRTSGIEKSKDALVDILLASPRGSFILSHDALEELNRLRDLKEAEAEHGRRAASGSRPRSSGTTKRSVK